METHELITNQDFAKMEKLDAWLHLQTVGKEEDDLFIEHSVHDHAMRRVKDQSS